MRCHFLLHFPNLDQIANPYTIQWLEHQFLIFSFIVLLKYQHLGILTDLKFKSLSYTQRITHCFKKKSLTEQSCTSLKRVQTESLFWKHFQIIFCSLISTSQVTSEGKHLFKCVLAICIFPRPNMDPCLLTEAPDGVVFRAAEDEGRWTLSYTAGEVERELGEGGRGKGGFQAQFLLSSLGFFYILLSSPLNQRCFLEPEPLNPSSPTYF